MRFSLLTYNLLYNQAFDKLFPYLKKYTPDILCLQEIDTNESNLKKADLWSYKLADYSNSFLKFATIFGVATFFNPKKFTFLTSDVINLPRSIYEFFSILMNGGNRRSVLKTEFIAKPSGKKLTVYNLHLSLYGANSIRNKQLLKTLNESLDITSNNSIIVTGDFNYFPYRRKKLEQLMKKYGLREATGNIDYTLKYSSDGKLEKYNLFQKLVARILRNFFSELKVDYTFYRKLKLINSKRINLHFSDHFPVISYFEI